MNPFSYDALLEDEPAVEPAVERPVVLPADNPPAAGRPWAMLDPEAARLKFSEFQAQIATMKAQAGAHQITDQASLNLGIEMVAQGKKMLKAVDVRRKAIIEVPDGFVSSVNTFCRKISNDIKAIITPLDARVNAFMVEQDRLRREAERKAREEAEAERRRLEDEAAAERARIEAEAMANGASKEEAAAEAQAAVDPIIPVVPVTAPASTVTRTAEGTAHLRKDWAWEEVDFNLVPREYLMLDTKKLNQAVKAGVREIPGIRIFEKPKTNYRTK
jgi:hypothetical protein